ncbi:MAG TPA: pyridoxamine 5'-phosphate oxidase family protein [Acidimicrobiales bacterium]|nr:pyridoxamine 5'-phosphate oxidase family protein [Acidimicrobiales bacterium]
MDEPQPALRSTARATLRRKRERGHHDRAAVDAILDEAFVCHVGFRDGEGVAVLPTAYARVGDSLYLHGAAANHMLRALGDGAPACVTVTLVDGIVLARSAFHHSMNYRSVVLFGPAARVDDPDEKRRALLAIVDHVTPGRSTDARPPTESELRATAVVRFPIDEGSAKVRTGGPVEEPEDLDLPVWAGEIPLALAVGDPQPDAGVDGVVAVPAYVSGFRRPASPAPAHPSSADPARPPAPGG